MAADKSLLYLSQARIYSALALKNIQASLMFLARLCYIFGGSEIYRLPYIHLLQNNSAPMDRSKNSIQMGYQCKNPFAFAKLLPLNIASKQPLCSLNRNFVCSLFIFYIFVSRSFPLPSAFLSTDIERGKGFRAEYSPQEEDSVRNGLPPRPFNFQGLMYYLRRRAEERSE